MAGLNVHSCGAGIENVVGVSCEFAKLEGYVPIKRVRESPSARSRCSKKAPSENPFYNLLLFFF